jgi:hypothetical protein
MRLNRRIVVLEMSLDPWSGCMESKGKFEGGQRFRRGKVAVML